MKTKKLPRQFYQQPGEEVARQLLGKYLVHRQGRSIIAGRINETELYRGDVDKACHAYPFKKTGRTEIMFGPGGFAYIYLIYGIYNCMNVVVEKEGSPCAVLIRGADLVLGLERAAGLRYHKPYGQLNKKQIRDFSNGPGKLCKALAIDKSLHKEDLCGGRFFIASEIEGIENIQKDIAVSTRIGIDYAEEAKDFLWRYFLV